MKKLSETFYIETLADVTNKVKEEIPYAFSSEGHCEIYIATLNNANHSEIFVNETSLFLGPENACKKILKDILKNLQKSNYNIVGNIKDVVSVKRA